MRKPNRPYRGRDDRKRKNPQELEDFAYVLDVIRKWSEDRRSGTVREEFIVYAIGDKNFTLLELTPKRNAHLDIGERVYIGKNIKLRDKIEKVRRKVFYDELSDMAKKSLPMVLERIISDQEGRFIEFINTAGPLNLRTHKLELTPGLGKKVVKQIIDERSKEPFKSFEDLRSRVKGIQDPIKMFRERILKEMLEEEIPVRLFTHYQKKPAPRSII